MRPQAVAVTDPADPEASELTQLALPAAGKRS